MHAAKVGVLSSILFQAILRLRPESQVDLGPDHMRGLPTQMRTTGTVDTQFVEFVLVPESDLDGLLINSRRRVGGTFAKVNHR